MEHVNPTNLRISCRNSSSMRLISVVAGTNIKFQTFLLLQLCDDVEEVFHRWIA